MGACRRGPVTAEFTRGGLTAGSPVRSNLGRAPAARDTDAGPPHHHRPSLDYPLSPRLFGGLALDLHGVSAENSEDTETLLGVSLTLKADIPQDALTFRPGGGLGFGRVDFGQETSQHLTLQGLVDLVFPRPDMSFLVEVSVYASPAGGTDCCDVTFGPGGTLRAGIIF